MSVDLGTCGVGEGLGAAELAAELVVDLPERPLMRHHRISRRVHRLHTIRHFDTFGFNRFDRFDTFGFGRVSNFNATSQSIFNPQVAVGFGGGNISQFGGNTNFNSNVQFGF